MSTVLRPVAPPAPPAGPNVPPPVRPAAPAQTGASPLSAEQLQQLTDANYRARKITKAGKLALFNIWTVGIFAVLSLLFAVAAPLFGQFDSVALVMGVGFSAVTWNESRGRTLLCRFDPRGPRVLGWNQIGLLALLVGYCVWNVYTAYTGANPYEQQISEHPELARTLGPVAELHRLLTLVIYGAIAAGSAVFQGLNALYYFTRARHVRAYLAQTPPWVVQLQRHTAG